LKLVKGGLGLTAYRLMGWPRRTVGLPGPERPPVPGESGLPLKGPCDLSGCIAWQCYA